MKSTIRKYTTRLIVALLIYLFFKVSGSEGTADVFSWYLVSTIQLTYIIVVVLVIWGMFDTLLKWYVKRYEHEITSRTRLVKLFITSTILKFPLIIAASYFSEFKIKFWLECQSADPVGQFWIHSIQGLVLAWLLISSQIILFYVNKTKEVEKEAALMQKELLRSKYESLKNQVNPHFLFNSFSVLTALIHRDPDHASDFVTMLSKMYRYILDNKEQTMVSLEKELTFLETYLFLLKTRHEQGIIIEKEITLPTDQFFIPTLSLQMLIENAVKHNSFSEEKPLVVKIYNEGEDYLVVRNSLQKKHSEVKSTKIGLENINKRYCYETKREIVVKEDEQFFVVKLPVLTSLSVA
ncbi:MAG: histidine kinase [Bacteroidota bacterium]